MLQASAFEERGDLVPGFSLGSLEGDDLTLESIGVSPLRMVIDQEVALSTDATLVRSDDDVILEDGKVLPQPENLFRGRAGILGWDLRQDHDKVAEIEKKRNALDGLTYRREIQIRTAEKLRLLRRLADLLTVRFKVGERSVHVDVNSRDIGVFSYAHVKS